MTQLIGFSEAVDRVMARVARADRRADVIDYVNLTLSECQQQDSVGHSLFYVRDLVEDQLTADAEPFTWTRPATFRKLKTVYYPESAIYPDNAPPGRKQRNVVDSEFYYGAGNYFVFSGIAVDGLVDIAYWAKFSRLNYYASGARPASFDVDTQSWVYLTPPANEAAEEAAQALVSNWLLLSYFDAVVEGACAKVFKGVGDPRASTSFALYKNQQDIIKGNEATETVDD